MHFLNSGKKSMKYQTFMSPCQFVPAFTRMAAKNHGHLQICRVADTYLDESGGGTSASGAALLQTTQSIIVLNHLLQSLRENVWANEIKIEWMLNHN